jgi:hypothetical protein
MMLRECYDNLCCRSLVLLCYSKSGTPVTCVHKFWHARMSSLVLQQNCSMQNPVDKMRSRTCFAERTAFQTLTSASSSTRRGGRNLQNQIAFSIRTYNSTICPGSKATLFSILKRRVVGRYALRCRDTSVECRIDLFL